MRKRNSWLWSLLLMGMVLVLHYFVYLGNASGEVPLLKSAVDSPLELEEIELTQLQQPSYLNPFKRVTYCYQFVGAAEGDPCELSERATGLFSHDLEPVNGDPTAYWDGYEEEGFLRSLVPHEYPNLIYFVLQYVLVLSSVFLLFLPENRLGNKQIL